MSMENHETENKLAEIASWRSKEAQHQPAWPDSEALASDTAFLRSLPPLVFAGEADKLTEDFGKFISESGWVGSESQRASEELYHLNGEKDGKTGKLKYYLKITFIPLEAMQFRYPVLKKAPFLLPVFWFVRIVRAVFKRQEVIKDVSGHFKDADIQRGNEISALKRKIGL